MVPGSVECRRAGSTGAPTLEEFQAVEAVYLELSEADEQGALAWWFEQFPEWPWIGIEDSARCPIVIQSERVLP